MSSGRLSGQVSIVTGGGQGFGAGIVRRFAVEGSKVLALDLNSDLGPQVVQQAATAAGVPADDVVFRKADVTSRRDWEAALEECKERWGRLDVVVNNAGWTYPNKPTGHVTEAEFDKVFDVNVKSIYLSSQVIVPYFQSQGKGGSFITVSSTAAIRPRSGLTWYCATKAAVSTASKAMALEYAKDQIRFNCICPVAGNTPLLSVFLGQSKPGVPVTDAQLNAFKSTVPLGRLSEPEDVANAAVFFADPASAFVTGTDLEVDGGRCV